MFFHGFVQDCARSLEIWLHVAGAEALTFNELPLPAQQVELQRRGESWSLQAGDRRQDLI